MISCTPLVSVILITYNQKRFILKALKGVSQQKTEFSFEVLIGDDASDDETPFLIANFLKEHEALKSELILRAENVGASANLYDLCLRAKGKYIALLEGDDYWIDSYKLQKQVDFLECHIDYIACTHDCNVVDETGNLNPDQKVSWLFNKREYTLNNFKGIFLPGQTSTLMFYNIFIKPKKDYSIICTAHRLISDRVLILILASRGKIYRLPYTMGCYRKNIKPGGGNATSKVFVNNTDTELVQYLLTDRMEEYAKSVLGVKIFFTGFKLKLIIKATLKVLLKFEKSRVKSYRELIKKVFSHYSLRELL